MLCRQNVSLPREHIGAGGCYFLVSFGNKKGNFRKSLKRGGELGNLFDAITLLSHVAIFLEFYISKVYLMD